MSSPFLFAACVYKLLAACIYTYLLTAYVYKLLAACFYKLLAACVYIFVDCQFLLPVFINCWLPHSVYKLLVCWLPVFIILLLACEASVPVRTKNFFRDRRAFSAFWPRENWGESKKVGGVGRGEEGTLASKPHDSEKCPPIFHGWFYLLIDSLSTN